MSGMNEHVLPPETLEFYCDAMRILDARGLPFLVGGAYALGCYTGISRHTKDFDVFVRESDIDEMLEVLEEHGYRTDVRFAHWLAKAYHGEDSIDFIFRSGNGISQVDDSWFERGRTSKVLGMEAKLCPPEEILWTKAYIMERERFDGADVIHLLRWCAEDLDWDRLLALFGRHWRVLMSHLLLFGFVYPGERHRIPKSVMKRLIGMLEREMEHPPLPDRLCRGTLLSRQQYLIDIQKWDYTDARKRPVGEMTAGEIDAWTEAIRVDGSPVQAPPDQPDEGRGADETSPKA